MEGVLAIEVVRLPHANHEELLVLSQLNIYNLQCRRGGGKSERLFLFSVPVKWQLSNHYYLIPVGFMVSLFAKL